MSQSQHPSQSSRRSKKRAKDLTKKTKKTKLADSSGMLWRRNFLVCPPTICYKQSRLLFMLKLSSSITYKIESKNEE
jgi:hypothetical protein